MRMRMVRPSSTASATSPTTSSAKGVVIISTASTNFLASVVVKISAFAKAMVMPYVAISVPRRDFEMLLLFTLVVGTGTAGGRIPAVAAAARFAVQLQVRVEVLVLEHDRARRRACSSALMVVLVRSSSSRSGPRARLHAFVVRKVVVTCSSGGLMWKHPVLRARSILCPRVRGARRGGVVQLVKVVVMIAAFVIVISIAMQLLALATSVDDILVAVIPRADAECDCCCFASCW